LYVPEGDSVWEMGTPADYLGKANEDYRKRSKNPGAVDPATTTFVFVTPRRWRGDPTIEGWTNEKLAERVWKDVRVIDGAVLEDWLEQCPAVAARVAREMLPVMPATGVQSTDEFWDDYAFRFNPALTEKVLLASRQDQAAQLVNQLAANSGAYMWQADSIEEVVAFAVATIRSAEPDVRRFLEDRTLIVDTEEAAGQLAQKSGMVFLPRGSARNHEGRLAQRNPVVVSIGRDSPNRAGVGVLERPTTSAFAEALKTMGLAPERADQLARHSGRSVTILARRIPSGSAQNPQWAAEKKLIPAVLMGGWDARSEHDREALRLAAGADAYTTYSDYEHELLPFLKIQDSPFEKEGDVWTVRAPVDALAYLGHLVGERDLRRLEEVARTVFGDTDPALDLPEDQRPYAQLSGDRLKHSEWLRTGLATTLLLMSVLHEQLDLTNANCMPDQFVEQLIAGLPGLATDYRRIASLHGELMLLMEAAPRPLLASLGQMLEGDGAAIRPIFQDKDPVFSQSPHTGLLWALEVLAWDPRHIADATLTLAKLAKVDPGGKLMNRPINSLRDILLAWHPNTNASLVQRIAALDQIIKWVPDVGWELVVKLLPGYHEVVSPTAQPRYREAGASEREVVTYGLVHKAYDQVIERALKLAGQDSERWTTLIRQMSVFNDSQRKSMLDALMDFASKLTSNQRHDLWSALRGEVARHRAFPSAQWAMKEDQLTPFEALVGALEPPDAVMRVVWLFNEYHPHIPQKEEEAPRLDLVEKTREKAVRNLLHSGGMGTLLSLAESAALPDHVALTVASIMDKADGFAFLVESAMDRPGKLNVFAAVLSARAELKLGTAWRNVVGSWASQRRWQPEQLITLVLGWRDERSSWDFVASLGVELEQIYWKRKSAWPLQGDVADLEFAAQKYLEGGRAVAAIQALHYEVGRIPADIVFRILDAAVAELNAMEAPNVSGLIYQLEQVFDALQRRDDVPKIEIAKREYAYLPLFGYHERQLTLHGVMAEDPVFYVGLLCDAFKRKTGEAREPTEELRARAKAAYRLLSEFRTVPGAHGGEIDAQALRSWVEEVRRLGHAEDRAAITDEFLGHVLGHSPEDADGAWPHRVVRYLIEDLASQEVELGIEIERFNMQGVQSRGLYEGGGRERAKASQTREWAKTTRVWPRTSSMLERIGQSWDRHAQEEDERARHDEMRFEA